MSVQPAEEIINMAESGQIKETGKMREVMKYDGDPGKSINVNFNDDEKEPAFVIQMLVRDEPKNSCLSLIDHAIVPDFVRQCRRVMALQLNMAKVYDGATNLVRVACSDKLGFYRFNIVKDPMAVQKEADIDQITVELPESELLKILNCMPNIQ